MEFAVPGVELKSATILFTDLSGFIKTASYSRTTALGRLCAIATKSLS